MAANEGFFDHESVWTITGVLEGEEVHYVTEGKEEQV